MSFSPGHERANAIHRGGASPCSAGLVTTGHARNAIVHHGQLDLGVQFLAKPYTQRELAQKLGAVIDAANEAS
jgi:hypothetical protein